MPKMRGAEPIQPSPNHRVSIAFMAPVVTTCEVRVVTVGIGVLAWRGEVIGIAVAGVEPGRAARLLAIDHRRDRRGPVVCVVGKMRAGKERHRRPPAISRARSPAGHHPNP
jgi:hypothetical protein